MALLKGFDTKFTDFPEYILGVTREVWEGRGISTLRDYYAPGIIVRSPASVVVGNEGVIAATMATQAEFPDRALLGGRRDLERHPGRGNAQLAPDSLHRDAFGGRSVRASERSEAQVPHHCGLPRP